MARELKKKPSDYPQLAFRVDQEFKDEIQQIVDRLHKKANRAVGDGEKRVKKNEILQEALRIGLQKMASRA